MLGAQDHSRGTSREFVSERWGFRITLPAEWLVELRGPVRAGCGVSSHREVKVRPAWLASKRIAERSDVDWIVVSFTRAPFDSVAAGEGFFLADTAWARERGYGARRIWTYGTDTAAVSVGNGWQAIEGFAIARVDHPHPAPGEPAFDFDNAFQSVARFPFREGCALMLSVRIISHVSPDESLAEVWRSVRVGRLNAVGR